ncbi:MAG: hypothetical protein RL095_2279 [Verrucomicrobiota bacterium]|jgi:hypothetical protein
MTKPPRLDTSCSRFRGLRERGCYLIDKSLFIEDLLLAEQSLVIPRPRRFGKTTNLDMAAEFFDLKHADQAQLFQGMKILENRELCAKHMGKHPVLTLTLKDWQSGDIESLHRRLAMEMSGLVGQHRAAWGALDQEGQEIIHRISSNQASCEDLQKTLGLLCQALTLFHKIQPVVLIDEYDAPIHAAYAKGYYPAAIDLLRPWLSSIFKDSPYVFKACLTGILRISRESLFSGLNNVEPYTIINRRHKGFFLDKFGFTEDEVRQILVDFGKEDYLEACRAWYNGYKFGPHTIYNPWSITHYASSDEAIPEAFWVNTSSNLMIWEQLKLADDEDRKDMMEIVAGGSVRREIVEATSLIDLPSSDALWSLMLFAGYLKADEKITDDEGVTTYKLEIPNREVQTTFRTFVRDAFSKARVGPSKLPFVMLAEDRIADLQESLESYFLGCASYFDLGQVPENFIHGLFFGICSHLRKDFVILSNPETGKGRADLLMIPRDPAKKLSAKLIEFKVATEAQTIEQALVAAFEQIVKRDYAARLREAQCERVLKIGIAVKGKVIKIECR